MAVGVAPKSARVFCHPLGWFLICGHRLSRPSLWKKDLSMLRGHVICNGRSGNAWSVYVALTSTAGCKPTGVAAAVARR